MSEEIVKDHINKKYIQNIIMINEKDKFSSNCGISSYYITKKQINELLKGKIIYFDDGEYSHLIYFKNELK